jgi:hypothetical protein
VPGGGRWGVADYAMQELLVPVLVRVPRDGRAEPFAVFRPFARRWDVGTVAAEERAGLVAITIRWEGKADAEALLLTPEGDYLFGENAGPLRARRVPANQSRVRRLMEAINRRT